jgi:hypothetical protein
MKHSRWLGGGASNAPGTGHRLGSAPIHRCLVAKRLIVGRVKLYQTPGRHATSHEVGYGQMNHPSRLRVIA